MCGAWVLLGLLVLNHTPDQFEGCRDTRSDEPDQGQGYRENFLHNHFAWGVEFVFVLTLLDIPVDLLFNAEGLFWL